MSIIPLSCSAHQCWNFHPSDLDEKTTLSFTPQFVTLYNVPACHFFYSLLFKCSSERRCQANSSGDWRSLLVINVDTPPFSSESLSRKNPSASKILIALISTLILSSFLFTWIPSTNNKETSSVVFSSTTLDKTRQALYFVSPGLADGFFFFLFENNWVQKDVM